MLDERDASWVMSRIQVGGGLSSIFGQKGELRESVARQVIPHWLRRCQEEGIQWMLWLDPGLQFGLRGWRFVHLFCSVFGLGFAINTQY